MKLCDHRETKACSSIARLDNASKKREFSRYRIATFKDEKTLFTCHLFKLQLIPRFPKITLYFKSHEKGPHVHWSVRLITLLKSNVMNWSILLPLGLAQGK